MFGGEWNGFGTLLALFGIGSKIKDDIGGFRYDQAKKRKAINTGDKTYVDRRGIERSIKSNNKTWNVTDDEGYDITIDSKTKEVLSDKQRDLFLKEKKSSKDQAIRGGYVVYEYPIKTKTASGFPKTEYVYCRTSDDKPVSILNGNYVIPIFGLIATDNNDWTIRKNREALYNYCRKWYVDMNMNGPHPNEIKEKAKEYGVLLFDEDINYCLSKVENVINNGGPIELEIRAKYDDNYSNANWVEKKYWI